MTRRALTILLATVLMSGCGTFADIMSGPTDGQVYYRGVSRDLEGITGTGLIGLPPLLVLDLPFSAVADTMLLPFQAYFQMTGPQTASQTSGLDRSMPTSQIDQHRNASEQYRRLWLEEQRATPQPSLNKGQPKQD